MKTVIDLPEADVIAALRPVVLAHTAAHGDAMDVDAPSGMPALSSFLAQCVEYPASAPTLRFALRQHLPEAEHIVAVMEILYRWLDGSFAAERQLLLPEDERTLAVTGTPPVTKVSPPLPLSYPKCRSARTQLVEFLRTLVDASFLALLQHRPARALLQRLNAHLAPEAELFDELQRLRAPLDAFARAHATREAGAHQKGREKGKEQDWRRRRKAAHERAAVGVGLYQVEELYL
jgi:hypothetical protein